MKDDAAILRRKVLLLQSAVSNTEESAQGAEILRIGETLRLSRTETLDIAEELEEAGLLSSVSYRRVRVTSSGRRYLESRVDYSSGEVTFPETDEREDGEAARWAQYLLLYLLLSKDSSKLDQVMRTGIEDALRSYGSELATARPRLSALKKSLRSLARILEGATGNVTAHGLLELLRQFL